MPDCYPLSFSLEAAVSVQVSTGLSSTLHSRWTPFIIIIVFVVMMMIAADHTQTAADESLQGKSGLNLSRTLERVG